MLKVEYNTPGSLQGTVRLGKYARGFYHGGGIIDTKIGILSAKSHVFRQWLWGFVLNRSIANQQGANNPLVEQTGNILMSFLNELTERKKWYKTFKSIRVHADKYRLMSKKGESDQTRTLEEVIAAAVNCEKECEDLKLI